MSGPFAVLFLSNDNVFEMFKSKIVIGRKSIKHDTDVEVESSPYISRHHLEIHWKNNSLKLRCKGKNGVFIDKNFEPFGSVLRQVPSKCTLRFPSTSICIKIQQCFLLPIKHSSTKTNFSLHSDYKKGFFSSLKKCTKLTGDENDDEDSDLDCSFEDSSYFPSVICVENSSRTRRKQSLIPFNQTKIDEKNEEIRKSVQVTSLLNSENCLENQKFGLNTETNAFVTNATHTLGEENITYSVPTVNTFETSNGSNLHKDYTSDKQILSSQTLIHPTGYNALDTSSIILPNNSNKLTAPTCDRWDCFTKPPFSYAQLISQSIASQSDHQITLSKIYEFISTRYPYYRITDRGWQNSVRHNLSLNRQFIKVPRIQDHGKGCFWRIDPIYETKLLQTAFRKRRSRVFDNPSFGKSSLAFHNGSRLRSYYISNNLIKYPFRTSIPLVPSSIHKIAGIFNESKLPKKIQVISTSLKTSHPQMAHKVHQVVNGQVQSHWRSHKDDDVLAKNVFFTYWRQSFEMLCEYDNNDTTSPNLAIYVQKGYPIDSSDY